MRPCLVNKEHISPQVVYVDIIGQQNSKAFNANSFFVIRLLAQYTMVSEAGYEGAFCENVITISSLCTRIM